jgi:hypothetical protein
VDPGTPLTGAAPASQRVSDHWALLRYWLLAVVISLGCGLLVAALTLLVGILLATPVSVVFILALILGSTLVGVIQARFLQSRFPAIRRNLWIVITLVGCTITTGVAWGIFLLAGRFTNVFVLLLALCTGPICGLLLGISQWFVLRTTFARAAWWILASVIGASILWIILGLLGSIFFAGVNVQ